MAGNPPPQSLLGCVQGNTRTELSRCRPTVPPVKRIELCIRFGAGTTCLPKCSCSQGNPSVYDFEAVTRPQFNSRMIRPRQETPETLAKKGENVRGTRTQTGIVRHQSCLLLWCLCCFQLEYVRHVYNWNIAGTNKQRYAKAYAILAASRSR